MAKAHAPDQPHKPGNINWTPFVLSILIVIACWISSYFIILHFVGTEGAETTGDTFGVINALFSGLAFAGIIYAILLQREELQAPRKLIIDLNKIV